MENFAIEVIVLAVSIYLVERLTRLFYVNDFLYSLLAAVALALVNSFLRPVLLFISFPINFLTLGLFTFFINGFCLQIAAWFIPKFYVRGCFSSSIAALLISLVKMLFYNLMY
ncbi:MAG: phage holin family protein [Candidatus Cloacimonadota bacterium]|nr:phage holin family protein [Candidatus Cloacimonadota bacterium]